jgi:hypothetical protein
MRTNWTFPFQDFLAQPELLHNCLLCYESEIHQYTAKEQGILLQACLLWRIFYDVVHRLQAKYPEWIYLRQEDISRSPAESFRQL